MWSVTGLFLALWLMSFQLWSSNSIVIEMTYFTAIYNVIIEASTLTNCTKIPMKEVRQCSTSCLMFPMCEHFFLDSSGCTLIENITTFTRVSDGGGNLYLRNSNSSMASVPIGGKVFFGDDGLLYTIVFPKTNQWQLAYDVCKQIQGFRLAQIKTSHQFALMEKMRVDHSIPLGEPLALDIRRIGGTGVFGDGTLYANTELNNSVVLNINTPGSDIFFYYQAVIVDFKSTLTNFWVYPFCQINPYNVTW